MGLYRWTSGVGVAVAMALVACGCSDDFRGTLLAPLMFSEAANDSSGLYREPNDTPEQAVLIRTDGTRIRQTIHLPSDVDYFRFLAAAGAQYLVNVETETGGSLQLEITDERGVVQPVTVVNAPGANRSTRSWTTAESGYYFVRVSAPVAANSVVGTYSVWIVVGEDGFEPDNTISQAKEIAINGTWQQHTLPGMADKDYMSFSAWANFHYEFLFDGASGEHVSFAVVDGSGNSVSSRGAPSLVRFDAPSDGTYFVEVTPVDLGALGTYRVCGFSTDPWEPDSTLALATPISTTGEPQRHSFSRVSDQDYLKFQAAAGVTYIIRTDSLGYGVDTQIEIDSASGTALVSDDNSGGGNASMLVWTAPVTGAFFVRVRSTTGGFPGKYVVSIKSN